MGSWDEGLCVPEILVLSWFNAKPFVITTYAQKVLFYSFVFKSFSLFAIVKVATNYAKIDRVGKLEADFHQVSFVQFFFFSQIVVKYP